MLAVLSKLSCVWFLCLISNHSYPVTIVNAASSRHAVLSLLSCQDWPAPSSLFTVIHLVAAVLSQISCHRCPETVCLRFLVRAGISQLSFNMQLKLLICRDSWPRLSQLPWSCETASTFCVSCPAVDVLQRLSLPQHHCHNWLGCHDFHCSRNQTAPDLTTWRHCDFFLFWTIFFPTDYERGSVHCITTSWTVKSVQRSGQLYRYSATHLKYTKSAITYRKFCMKIVLKSTACSLSNTAHWLKVDWIKSQCISIVTKGWGILLFGLVVTLEGKSRANSSPPSLPPSTDSELLSAINPSPLT